MTVHRSSKNLKMRVIIISTTYTHCRCLFSLFWMSILFTEAFKKSMTGIHHFKGMSNRYCYLRKLIMHLQKQHLPDDLITPVDSIFDARMIDLMTRKVVDLQPLKSLPLYHHCIANHIDKLSGNTNYFIYLPLSC